MNINLLIVLHIIFWLLIGIFEDKILKTNYFNKKFFKSYYLKRLDNFMIPRHMVNSLKVNKDGFVEMLNDKAYLFKFGIFIPFLLFMILWPFIAYCWYIKNYVVVLSLISFIILPIYCSLINTWKYYHSNYDKLNENYPYVHSYYTFGLHYNLVTFIIFPMIVIKLYINPDLISILLFIIILIKLHVYLFIEKIDLYFNLSILEAKNLSKIIIFESIFVVIIGIILITNGLY